MHEQATVNIQTADAIFHLHTEMRERFREVLNSQFHDQALDFVFASPVFRNDRFRGSVGDSGIFGTCPVETACRSRPPARTMEPAAGRRAALYAFDPLLDLLKV